ncbi:glycosyl transferase family protein [Marinomonas piezotolerans]|uniref:Glycosyl transferase family protein n=1 Tax=Marinomonas piezotolerans TaxID=2213058 RepID=A0A370UDZ2_9GAMM|nr:glycosyl transferase family protein [Marinomonas piezotolerans]RDL46008.1 glycosyl transferase family protein [Marinomonas piezotolerans]
MSLAFAPFIKILGRGNRGSRSLTTEEAQKAMSMMLVGEAAPEQIGAFWMLIRIREETVDETVGFTQAVREYLKEMRTSHSVDLDWPAYAGKRNELPWFLLAALALANYGVKVLMHGHSFEGEQRLYVDEVISALALPICLTSEALDDVMQTHHFVYMPLNSVSPKLAQMMDLKYTLGLRSPVNTVVRMMNPFNAQHSVHGVFHKGYDELHVASSKLLEDKSVLVFRGGNGEVEVNPERDVTLGKLQDNEETWETWPKAEQNQKRLKNDLSLERLILHWRGEVIDPFGEQAVRQTLASVVGLVFQKSNHQECLELADHIWQKRQLDTI